jgi:hypothetical protein
MSRVRIVLAALVASAALVVLAVPASASVPAANAKFCQAAEAIGDNTAGQPTASQARASLNGFKKAAKHAPGKVKKAMINVSKYLGVIAGAEDPADLAELYTGNGFKTYSKSITTYVNYYVRNCAGT